MSALSDLMRAGVVRRALGYSGSLAVSRLVSAAMTIVSTGILIQTLGPSVFGVFAVITGLYTMLSVIEVGSAVGVNTLLAEAEQDGDPDRSRQVVSSAFALMSAVGAGLVLVALLLTWLLPWPLLTGAGDAVPPETVRLAVGVYLVTFALSVPVAVFSRVLDGLRLSQWNALYVLAVPGVLLAAALVLRPSTSLVAYAFFAVLGSVVVGLLAMLHVRRFGGGRLRPRRDAVHGVVVREVWHRSWPMAIVAGAGMVAFSLDPIVVASALGSDTAAQYVLGAKIATLLTLAVTAPTPVLWNYFAGRRARTGAAFTSTGLWRLQGAWAVMAAVLAAGMVVLGPAFASWWSRGDIDVPRGLFVAFGLNLVVTAFQYPAVTAMNDAASLRFQAVTMTTMAVLNLALSLVLVRTGLGVVGPVVASLLTLALINALPVTRRAHRLLP